MSSACPLLMILPENLFSWASQLTKKEFSNLLFGRGLGFGAACILRAEGLTFWSGRTLLSACALLMVPPAESSFQPPTWFGEWRFHVCTGWGRGAGSGFETPCFQLSTPWIPIFRVTWCFWFPNLWGLLVGTAGIHVGFSPCRSFAESRQLKCNPVTLPLFLFHFPKFFFLLLFVFSLLLFSLFLRIYTFLLP